MLGAQLGGTQVHRSPPLRGFFFGVFFFSPAIGWAMKGAERPALHLLLQTGHVLVHSSRREFAVDVLKTTPATEECVTFSDSLHTYV